MGKIYAINDSFVMVDGIYQSVVTYSEFEEPSIFTFKLYWFDLFKILREPFYPV